MQQNGKTSRHPLVLNTISPMGAYDMYLLTCRVRSQVYDAFRFMDTDNSGELSRDEVRDGFYALGVDLSDGVAEQIFQVSKAVDACLTCQWA